LSEHLIAPFFSGFLYRLFFFIYLV